MRAVFSFFDGLMRFGLMMKPCFVNRFENIYIPQ